MNSGPSHANAKWYGIAAFQPFVLNLQQGRTGSRWLIERRLILFVCQLGEATAMSVRYSRSMARRNHWEVSYETTRHC